MTRDSERSIICVREADDNPAPVAEGSNTYGPTLQADFMPRPKAKHEAWRHFPLRPLNERERVTLGLIACGLRVSRIAERLAASESTVELHVRNARKKLGARTTPQAVARAMILGVIMIDPFQESVRS